MYVLAWYSYSSFQLWSVIIDINVKVKTYLTYPAQ